MKAKVMATVYSMMFLAALFLSGCGSALRYDNAAKAYEKGQYDQALKLYQQIVKESPKGKAA